MVAGTGSRDEKSPPENREALGLFGADLAVALFQVFLDGANGLLQFLHFTAQIIAAFLGVLALAVFVTVFALGMLAFAVPALGMGGQFLGPIMHARRIQVLNGGVDVFHPLLAIRSFALAVFALAVFALAILAMLGDFFPDLLKQFRRSLFFAGLTQLGNLPLLLLHPTLQLVAVVFAGFVALFTALGGGTFVSLEKLLRLGGQRLRSFNLALFAQCIYFRLALLQPSLDLTMLAIPLAVAFAAWFVPFAIAFATGLVALTIAAGFIPFSVALDVALFPVAVALDVAFLVAIGPFLGKQQQAGSQTGKEDA